ncbi:MAG TPA: two-component regulator propeller domain-containing protein [Candidatus Cloacimonadota bacterium]|nr:two-component regulator propeller domain-containing protein [Candidatus Cloacimonadota bacterium]
MRNTAVISCLILLLGLGSLFSQNRDFLSETITSTTNILCSAEDPDYLYLGTQGGLLRVDKTTGSKHLFHIANSPLGSNEITALAFDQEHKLWVGTQKAGLYSWDGSLWEDYNDYLFAHGIKTISGLCVDANDNIWTHNSSGNDPVLLKFDGLSWTEYNPTNSVLPAYPIAYLAAGPNGELWILSFSYFENYTPGVGWESWSHAYLSSVIDGGMSTLDLYGDAPHLQYILAGELSNIEVDSSGRVWLLTQDNGGTWWIRDGQAWSPLRIDSILGAGFTVTDMAFGSDNILWVCSRTQLAKLSPELIPTLYPVSSVGLVPKNILSVYQNDLTFNIIRPYDSEPGYLRFEDGIWIACDSSTNPLDYHDYTYLEDYAIDLAGNLWVAGSINQGIFRWDGQNWTQFNTQNSQLSSNSIASIYADPTGGIWIGTLGHLTRVVGDSWTVYDCEASGLWHPKQIVRGPDNKLHVIDNSSIYTWDITNQTGHVYLSVANHLLPSNYLQDIAVDQYNRKWIATSNGLVRWLGNDVAFFSTSNSPFNTNNFTALQRDGDYMWIGTRTGQLARLFVNEFQMQDLSAFGDPPASIFDLVVDTDHSLWLSSGFGPLYHWSNGVLHSTDTAGHALTNAEKTWILLGPDGRKWLNVARNGIISFNGEIVANADPAEDASPVSILSNHPNPFHNSTKLSFRAPKTGVYNLQIFNLRGQLLRTAVLNSSSKSQVDWLWDGCNERGERLGAGVYFARLSWSRGSCSRKLLLLK